MVGLKTIVVPVEVEVAEAEVVAVVAVRMRLVDPIQRMIVIVVLKFVGNLVFETKDNLKRPIDEEQMVVLALKCFLVMNSKYNHSDSNQFLRQYSAIEYDLEYDSRASRCRFGLWRSCNCTVYE